MTVTAKNVLKYTLLPRIVPRFRELVSSGFSHVAFFVAQVYRSVELLPAAHPYLNPVNIGRYGLRHVVTEAASNLKFKKENMDQVAVFGAIVLGLLILMAQLVILCIAMFINIAHAANLPDQFVTYFVTNPATYDIAHALLDRVFGLEDFFNSCVSQNIPCDVTHPNAQGEGAYPYPFHVALRAMFQMYSVGIMVIAVLIFCYFIVVVAVETAQSGTPFGRRFNHVWAPIRMVVALGLLVPLNQGLNSGQWILMYAAKWGSGFATNGWHLFLDTAVAGNETPTGSTPQELVAMPNPPPVNTLMEFFTVLSACKYAEETLGNVGDPNPPFVIDAFLVNPDLAGPIINFQGTNYQNALEHFQHGDILITFGTHRVGDESVAESGNVDPSCGVLKMGAMDAATAAQSPGSRAIHEGYYTFVQQMWDEVRNNNNQCGGGGTVASIGACIASRHIGVNNNPNAHDPTGAELTAILTTYRTQVQTILSNGIAAQPNSTEWALDPTMRDLGWAGAGIWYNKIAQMNGAVLAAAHNLPSTAHYPKIMKEVEKIRHQNDQSINGVNRFQCSLSGVLEPRIQGVDYHQKCMALYNAHIKWQDSYSALKSSGNILIDAINLIFGLEGLFNIHENSDLNIHPLAQLAAIGKGIIDSSVQNLGGALFSGIAGSLANVLNVTMVGTVGMAASKFLTEAALMGLSIGFVLYYVIPLLPFIYFFFAVSGWIKGIFEAMVGVPLWALAHIRIDGNGLPGDAAMSGYYLILEIFLRPILIIFGMLAGITIFTSMAKTLNDIWPLVTSNLTGFDNSAATAGDEPGAIAYIRSGIDTLFFTVIYTITVYMIGMSSFKLVDLVPNHILRWMGASVQSFGDQSGDPAQNLVRNTFMGSNAVTQGVRGGVSSATGAASSAGKFAADVTRST